VRGSDPFRAIHHAYLSYARACLQGGPISDLATAHRRIYEHWPSRTGLPLELANLAVLAVRVACQRELEAHGYLARTHYQPTVNDIAKQAQKIAGRHTDDGHRPGAEDSALAGRHAHWEEARWQLLHVISTAPNPASIPDGR
jgi:hypothetical protein